tara:strand:+ start:1319 stop:2182 length:864 start_codon:yes stop_codon:yes gene_type:complete
MYIKILYILKNIIKSLINPKYYLRIIFNDIKSFLKIYNFNHKIIFVVGLPKSGTTLIENFLSRIPGYAPRTLIGKKKNLRQGKLSPNCFDMLLNFQHSIFKTHIIPTEENINCLIKNNIKKIIFMYRDPRDIVISLYYFQKEKKYIKPEEKFYFNPNYKTKEKCFDFLIKNYIPANIKWIEEWQELLEKNKKSLDVFYLKYEDLITDKNLQFKKILNFYEININYEYEQNLKAHKNFFDFLTLELPGQKSTFRTGTKNNWVYEFNNNQKKYIHDNYQEFLKNYNYIQ